MTIAISKLSLKPSLHHFQAEIFGSTRDLIQQINARKNSTLIFACSEQGAAPDNVSFAKPENFVVLQHLAASVPSTTECSNYSGLSMSETAELFEKYDFRNIIVCGHLGCGVIRNWLRVAGASQLTDDIGGFRRRFEMGTRKLVEGNYSPDSDEVRYTIMICEHVLVQIENLISHPFISDRIAANRTSLHGWIVNDDTARVLGYAPKLSAFIPI